MKQKGVPMKKVLVTMKKKQCTDSSELHMACMGLINSLIARLKKKQFDCWDQFLINIGMLSSM
jgi:hypothetical protein